jgi:hypothetical protein
MTVKLVIQPALNAGFFNESFLDGLLRSLISDERLSDVKLHCRTHWDIIGVALERCNSKIR